MQQAATLREGTALHIKLENLSMRWGSQVVLDNLCFDEDVTTLALIGPSGSGKTTLLRILGGLQMPTSGSVTLDGAAVDYNEGSLPAYRANLGYVFQSGGLFQHLSIAQNITLPLVQVHGTDEAEARTRAYELLERFGLADQADKVPAQLSGGQQQRAAIARALAPRPGLLLLDEPTSALDPVYTNEVLDVIDSLRAENIHFIIVTHEMGFARNACDACAFLDQGTILEYGPSKDFFAHPAHTQTQHFLSRLLEWR